MFDLNSVKNFIIIGAHCDDVESRTGPLFSRLVRQGARGTYVVAVENTYVDARVDMPDALKALATRRAEAQVGAARLGAQRVEFFAFKSYYFYKPDRTQIFPAFRDRAEVEAMAAEMVYYGLPPVQNAYLFPECVKRLTDLIKEEQPDLIITHAPNDRHPDHYATARFVDLVVGDLNREGGNYTLWFREPGSGAPMDGWRPQVIVEVSEEDVAVGERAIDSFPSQHPHGIHGFVRRRHELYGRLIGVPFATGLALATPTRDGVWDSVAGFEQFIMTPPAPLQIYRL